MKMGKGRPRKPMAQHLREGTYNATRHSDRVDHLVHTGGEPQQPQGMTGQQAWMWQRIVSGLHPSVLAKVDEPKLISLCRWWAIFWEAMDELENTGPKDAGRAAAMRDAGNAWGHCERLMSQFGMSPVDRGKIKVEGVPAAKKVNPIEKLSQAAK